MSEKEALVSVPAPDSPIKLKARISLFNACTIFIGCIIGSGIFISPKGVLLETGSSGMALIVWLASGVFAMVGAICYAELGTLIPKSGGDYVYIYEAFGPLPSFLFLWVAIVIVNPTSLAIVAITCAQYSLQLFYPCAEESLIRMFAALLIALFTFINCLDVRAATRTNDFFTVAKLLALSSIVISGVYWLSLGYFENWEMTELTDGSKTQVSSIAMAFYSGVFSFSGFSFLNYMTEEVKNPFKNLPRAIYISMPIVTLVYILVNIAYFSVMTVDEILDSEAVAITFADKVLGSFGSRIFMPICVSLTCLGSLNSMLITCSRMFFSGAKNNQLPEFFAMISINQLTPVPSLILLGSTSIAMLFIGNVYSLVNYVSFADTVVFFTSITGLIKLRMTLPKEQLDARPIKISLVWPILFLAMVTLILVLPFFNNSPWELILGIILIFSGVPFYFIFIFLNWRPVQSVWIEFTHAIQKVLYCVPDLS